ncbi:MAG: hypothetical protein ACRDY7_05755 [Acidimicrobiia bacterium]
MADPPIRPAELLPLYEAFDDVGRAWLDEIVRVFNEGGYTEAVQALLVDEVQAPGAVDE